MRKVICKSCIYSEGTPGIKFNALGICNYCEMINSLQEKYQTGKEAGKEAFEEIVRKIKKDGRKKKYDCIVGVSGGTDSSYMVYLAKKYGLRPLAVHYDNTWNSAIATENIKKVLEKLNVDLYTHVVNNEEIDDIFKSFLFAGVPELDGSTDIALAEVMYRAASKYKVKYVLEGHSFITEGVSPLGSAYVDGKYIKSIHGKFGKLPMKTFPNMTFLSFMKWVLIKRIKKIRPYWYLDYSKEEARSFLEKTYGWQYYGGHHLENRMTAINHSYYLPKKFNIDQRNNTLSALVRNGKISQKNALLEYENPPVIPDDLLEYFLKRMNISEEKLSEIIKLSGKTYRDYKTYKPLFEKLRPLFYVLARANLVPMSFYIKYTSKDFS